MDRYSINNIKPTIVVSKCLGFEACRYNGQKLTDKFVESLKNYVNYITVCPEIAIGLPTPRDPIRVAFEENTFKLYQPKTGKDFTDEMVKFTEEYLNNIPQVDGFILKSSSPSCGLKSIKVYNGTVNVTRSTRDGVGFFGGKVSKLYSHLAVEDEGRLTNIRIRENFLTKLFLGFNFRNMKKEGSMEKLINFQSNNKFLLMAYSPKELTNLGRIVANHEHKSFQELIQDYENTLYRAISKMPRYTTNIHVLLEALGFFSKHISQREKTFILDSINKHKAGKVPISVPSFLIKSYAIRFDVKYLLEQTFFNPYPEQLVDLTDSGKSILSD